MAVRRVWRCMTRRRDVLLGTVFVFSFESKKCNDFLLSLLHKYSFPAMPRGYVFISVYPSRAFVRLFFDAKDT